MRIELEPQDTKAIGETVVEMLAPRAKAWRGKNPRGMKRQYKLVDGCKYMPQGDWHE